MNIGSLHKTCQTRDIRLMHTEDPGKTHNKLGRFNTMCIIDHMSTRRHIFENEYESMDAPVGQKTE